MSFYFPNVDPTYIYKREGTDDDPFLSLIDTNNVKQGKIVLKEIPSHKEEVVITDSKGNELAETESDSPSNDEYRIDYSVGMAYFNSSRNGEEMTCEYLGTGYVLISAERIMLDGDPEDPLDSLQDAFDSVEDAVNTLREVEDLDFVGEYSSSHDYKKWNFVNYNGKTFVATRGNKGIAPDDDSYWRLVSSGVGFAGVFDEDRTYTIGDLVTDKNRKDFYVSVSLNNDSDLDDEDKWELILTLKDTVKDFTDLLDAKIEELQSFKDQLAESDEQRDENDSDRDKQVSDALEDVNTVMDAHKASEKTRDDNERDRRSQENKRTSSEETRVAGESQREQQESQRRSKEDSRNQEFNNLLKDNLELTDEIDKGLQEISENSTVIEVKLGDAEEVFANVEIALEKIDDFKHVGDHDVETDYKQYNMARHDGSTYLALQDIDSEELREIDNEEYWGLLARKGKDGTQITVEGVEPDEDFNISLGELGYATENQIVDMRDDIREELQDTLGDLSELKTTKKDNVVESINELKRRIDDIIDVIS